MSCATDLSGFPTTCVTSHNDNLLMSHRLDDVTLELEDRQIALVGTNLDKTFKLLLLLKVHEMSESCSEVR